ncbi:MAG: hypothetical protein AAFQ96_05960 [Pseudomonadota bacterium]
MAHTEDYEGLNASPLRSVAQTRPDLESRRRAARPFKDNPDWRAAAQSLVDALGKAGDGERKVDLLYRIAGDLGEERYQALVKILCAVDAFGDLNARSRVSDTVHYAVKTWRFPPWPAPLWDVDGGGRATAGDSVLTPSVEIGPLEYVVLWRLQRSHERVLSLENYRAALRRLLSLIALSPGGADAYADHLDHLAASPLPGLFLPSSLETLSALRDGLRAHLAAGPLSEKASAIVAQAKTDAAAGRAR